MKTHRRKVLQQFTRNIGGQIVSGHPEHPDEHGRFLEFTDLAVADQLAAEGLVSEEDTAEKHTELEPKPQPQARELGKAIADAVADAIGKATPGTGTVQAQDNSLAGLAAEGAGKGVGGGDTGGVDGNDEGANGAVAGGVNAAQTVRERRAAGKPVADDQKRRGAAQRGGKGRATKVPAGGGETAATTNHPIESGPQTPAGSIPGQPAGQAGEGDEAPTGA